MTTSLTDPVTFCLPGPSRYLAYRLVCLLSLGPLFPTVILAQPVPGPTEASVSLFNNAIALPFTGKAGVLHAPVHPGLSAGVSNLLNRHSRHQLRLSLKLAYLYQRRSQHVVQLYPGLGYRLAMSNGIGVESELGVGYLHAFTDLEQFKLSGQGEYRKVPNRGRPGLMASLSAGLSYQLARRTERPVRLFSLYQVWFQTPFVKSYVPVLPNAALHLGGAFPLSRKTK